MSKEELKAYLEVNFPTCKFEDTIDFPVVIVEQGQLLSLLKSLREAPSTDFDLLFCQTAVDYKTRFEVIYHLSSTTFRHDLVVKVLLDDREHPELESIFSIWKAAELFENEIFDLFGIRFLNHPNLRRIILGDEWQGYPLRKDYTDANILIP
ncbi:MAG: NADH-quinone oxidoreductase subunit C [Bacteroidota bacterium]|nr:NADH-quinone oxidoreductase subunit C [Bacteroidota bacterium]